MPSIPIASSSRDPVRSSAYVARRIHTVDRRCLLTRSLAGALPLLGKEEDVVSQSVRPGHASHVIHDIRGINLEDLDEPRLRKDREYQAVAFVRILCAPCISGPVEIRADDQAAAGEEVPGGVFYGELTGRNSIFQVAEKEVHRPETGEVTSNAAARREHDIDIGGRGRAQRSRGRRRWLCCDGS